MTLLSVSNLSMRFGGLLAIDNLSFTAEKNAITAVIGPNGAGKTTVFNCITGFYKPTTGSIILHGDKKFELQTMPDFRITQKAKVARTFQNIRLFSGMTVLENLLVAQHNDLMVKSGYTIKGILGFKSWKRAEQEAMDLCVDWLKRINLLDKADDAAGSLAYGDQRRLEIARAMLTNPVLLCLDEPAAGLNHKESGDLNQLLLSLKNELNTSLLLIEHDMSVVMGISDKVVVLEYGRKIAEDAPEKVKNDPKVIAAYLGVDEEEEAA